MAWRTRYSYSPYLLVWDGMLSFMLAGQLGLGMQATLYCLMFGGCLHLILDKGKDHDVS